MPYPAQVTEEKIVTQARQLIEDKGVEQLSLARLASSLNVKAPSLYRHVGNKDNLLRLVNLKTIRELFANIDSLAEDESQSAADRLLAIGIHYREFAHHNPRTYTLAYGNLVEAQRPDPAVLEEMVLPLQALVAEITGEDDSLVALRGLFALLHGFVVLEINDQFRRGGDLTEVFGQTIAVYLQGWASKATAD